MKNRRITSRTITVFQVEGKGKSFQSLKWAYYSAAKNLIRAKYPNHEYGTTGDYYEKHPERENKRLLLFYSYVREYPDEASSDWHFDLEKWQRFAERVAKFLRFVDSRVCPSCESRTLIECKEGGQAVGMGCTECGAMFDLGGQP
jgi:hypothetical protein